MAEVDPSIVLADAKCGPCAARGGDPAVLSASAVAALMHQITHTPATAWKLVDDGKALERSFMAKNFVAALAAVNAIGAIAEEQGHHPDLHITGYRTVTIRLYTHSQGGLTLNDFISAAKYNQVHVEYSPAWLREHPDKPATE